MKTRHLLPLTLAALLLLPASALPSTFACAGGDVSCLVTAINTANTNGQPANTIRLGAGTYTLSVVDNDTNGTNGLPSITSTLSLVADTPGSTVTISRPSSAPRFRFLHVAAGASLTVDGIGFTGGSALSTGSTSPGNSNGGFLYNAGGTLSITGSTVSRNSAGSGAAIYHSQGTLSLTDTTVDHNSASGSGGLYAVSGTVTITGSVFDTNDATGFGGGLRSDAGVTLWIENSRFVGNNSHTQGAGVWISGSSAVILRTTFQNNIAESGAALFQQNAQVVVRDSSIVGNRLGGDTSGFVTAFGGHLDLINVTVTGNLLQGIATGASLIVGGGVTQVTNSTIAGNGGSQHGSIQGASVQNSIVQDTTLSQECRTSYASLGNNIIIGAAALCGVTLQGSDRSVDPALGALVDIGTPGGSYLPLLAGSPAIDSANPATCPTTDQLGHARSGICDIGAIESANGGGGNTDPSISGTRVPPASSIVDNQLASWTFGPGGETLRNGVAVQGYGTQYLWYQNVLYVYGLDGNWWQWFGTYWDLFGPNDPSSSSPATPSASGTQSPPASAIVDNQLASWTFGPNGETLRNGNHAAFGYGSRYLWYQNVLYVLGTDNNWWQWLGGGWDLFGPAPPNGDNPVATPSPSGARLPPASAIIDNEGASWTFGAGGETLRNGAHAGSGYGSEYLWYQNVLYVIGTDGNWWRWTGSGWVYFGPIEPF